MPDPEYTSTGRSRNSGGNAIVQFGTTFGVEFEAENPIRGYFEFENWRQTHDASIETPVYKSSSELGLTVTTEDIENFRDLGMRTQFQRVIIGSEFVSPILDSSDLNSVYLQICKLTGFLTNIGEIETGERSGIHIHVSLANPSLDLLKSIITLAGFSESFFFHISGMCRPFRGMSNDFTYCRPITRIGPSCVPYRDGWTNCFLIDDLLNSKNIIEFWTRYGDMPNTSNNRYNPVRYSWINLFPLYGGQYHKGTLEFRSFNKTLNPLYILSIIQLSLKFAEVAIRMSMDEELYNKFSTVNSVFDDFSIEQLEEQFEIFNSVAKIDLKSYQTLLILLRKSHHTVAKEEYVKTHIRDVGRYWGGRGYSPEELSSRRVKSPTYVDIHNIPGSRE